MARMPHYGCLPQTGDAVIIALVGNKLSPAEDLEPFLRNQILFGFMEFEPGWMDKMVTTWKRQCHRLLGAPRGDP